MGPFLRNSLLAVSFLIIPSSIFAWPHALPGKNIDLTFYSGTAPFTVRIIGPIDLVSSAVGYPVKFDWCGYRVSWGDGARTDYYKDYMHGIHESSCATGLEHIYTKPGNFTIKVIKFHPGPTDGIIKDWQGRTKVVVSQQGSPLL